MHIAHLKPGAIAGETARTQSRETADIGQLAERIVLIHKLGEL